MAHKTYKTQTIQEAIAKIKKEMGADAMILSTRRITSDSRNPYDRGLFEVTAVPHGGLGEAGSAELDLAEIGTPDSLFEKSQPAEPFVQPSAQHGTIREALMGIRDTLYLLQQGKGLPRIFKEYPEALKLYTALSKTGMSDERAEQFISIACDQLDKGAPFAELHKRIIGEIVQAVTVANPFADEAKEKNSGKRVLAAFVGPTGVGKTTTIAKLAADLCLKQKKRVGLLSVDSYRIGAIEQLKTYAAIIGLPCLAAFNRQDVLTAAKKMEHQDVILIDTAGQSHLDRPRLDELTRLLGGEPFIKNHLVTSITTRRSDMKAAVERFAVLHPSTYVFTKIDETRQRGGMIDQLLDHPMPISFVTNGQNVPEDILPATRNVITRMVFNQA